MTNWNSYLKTPKQLPDSLKAKIDSAKKIIEHAFNVNEKVLVGNSGGKDSTVILELTKMVAAQRAANTKNSGFVIVHNVKPMLSDSLDPVQKLTAMHPETLEFLYSEICRNNPVVVMHSSKMAQYLAAYKFTCQIDGARRVEYNRPGKSSEFIMDGKNVNRLELPPYVECGLFDISFAYPIFDWEDKDVFDFCYFHELNLSREYEMNGELEDWSNQ